MKGSEKEVDGVMSCRWKWFFVALVVSFLSQPASADSPARWSKCGPRRWAKERGWLVGCNFLPSTAVNSLEMWQAETFDPTTIDRELGWAESLGFNSVRVFLNSLLWQADAKGLRRVCRGFCRSPNKITSA